MISVKTLVAHGDPGRICIAVIPGDTELSLKALAAASDNRKVHLVPVEDLQKLTGLCPRWRHGARGGERLPALCG